MKTLEYFKRNDRFPLSEKEYQKLRKHIAEIYMDLVYMDADRVAGEALEKFKTYFDGMNEEDTVNINFPVRLSYGSILAIIGRIKRNK